MTTNVRIQVSGHFPVKITTTEPNNHGIDQPTSRIVHEACVIDIAIWDGKTVKVEEVKIR